MPARAVPSSGCMWRASTRDLAPIVRDEVHRRVRGGAQCLPHAEAGRIEVEIGHEGRQVRVRVRDDGKGIDPAIRRGRREGTAALGMHEWARLAEASWRCEASPVRARRPN